ncbi:collagen-binding protein [Filimonas zeae]|uniref:Collagen-binding protein n=2 Tax=Filimonas zeae TaxID=1737353 RepID=A0A917MV70_9BACT|nr:collagen-binding protein [Filimonas zeae]
MQLAAFSQHAVIQGKVCDSVSLSAVEGADVLLLAPKSHKPLLQTRTGSKGFVFKKVPEGSYGLVVLAMGFVHDTLPVWVKSGDTLRLAIALRPQENELSDVVVKAAPRPVSIRGDTLSFNAAAYALRPDAQLEDLLRQLPGVEVDKDGNITYMGKRVDKIMINGQEFFLGNTKSANSLPAEIIASIEAFSTRSNAATFSGIRENSETHTLNIKTKKGMEEAWLGSVYGSKGQDNNYAAGGTLTKLGKELMLKANLITNNINNRFTGVESKSYTPQAGLQSTTAWDVNVMKKWGDKLTANLAFNGNDEKTEVLESAGRRTFLTDSSLQENRQGHSLVADKKYPFNFRLTYNANERNQWELASSVTYNQAGNRREDTAAIQTLQHSGAGYTSSRVQTRNTDEQEGIGITNQLDWRHRFGRPGRTLQWSLRQSSQTGNSTGSLYSLLNGYAPTGALQQQTFVHQQYQQHTKGQQYGSVLTYTEPLSQLYSLLLAYNVITSVQQNDKASYDYDSLTGGFNTPTPLTSNRFQNRNTTHMVEGAFVRNERKFNYNLGLGWQYSLFNNISFLPNRHIRQHFTNLLPKASLNLLLRNGKTFSLNYFGYSTAPAIDQLQPLPDLSNPLFVKSGNPDLRQSFRHSLSLMLNTVNKKNYNGLSMGIDASFVRNQIVPSITLLPGGVQQQQFVNVNGNYQLGAAAVYSFGFAGKQGKKNRGSLQSIVSHGNDVSLINGRPNHTRSFSWAENLRLSYSLGTKLMAIVTSGNRFTLYRYSLSPQQNTRSWNHNATLYLNYELPLGITLQSSYTWLRMGTSGLLPAQSSSVLNAAIYKRLFAGGKWQLRLSGFDLLNANRNFTQSAGANYIYTRQTNQLQRMLLVSLLYNFKILHASER